MMSGSKVEDDPTTGTVSFLFHHASVTDVSLRKRGKGKEKEKKKEKQRERVPVLVFGSLVWCSEGQGSEKRHRYLLSGEGLVWKVSKRRLVFILVCDSVRTLFVWW